MNPERKRKPLIAEADLDLTFLQAVRAFRALSPKRMETLRMLRGQGPMTVYALAKKLKRHYANVFADFKALRKLGLVERDAAGLAVVPWEAVEIRFPIPEGKRGGRGK